MLLKDSIIFKGTSTQLKKHLQKNIEDEFYIDWLSEDEFKFISTSSFGTLVFHNSPTSVEGIKGFAKIHQLENDTLKIDLKTKIRIEIYFILFTFVFIFFCFYMSGEYFPKWLYSLLPISILWFWFIYRVQEKRLFNKFKNYIKE